MARIPEQCASVWAVKLNNKRVERHIEGFQGSQPVVRYHKTGDQCNSNLRARNLIDAGNRANNTNTLWKHKDKTIYNTAEQQCE